MRVKLVETDQGPCSRNQSADGATSLMRRGQGFLEDVGKASQLAEDNVTEDNGRGEGCYLASLFLLQSFLDQQPFSAL